MKLKFKIQSYQTEAVESVVDCLAGQVKTPGVSYDVNPGQDTPFWGQIGSKNADIQLTEIELMKNIHLVQRRQNLPLSKKLVVGFSCKVNLDVEMETGTGKTYCYIKTIFEMNKRYGWTKFIVIVPSIAIREGVFKSFDITAEHFSENYGKKARFFIYNSKQLHYLESFSSDAGINVMIINIQAFNAKGRDNLRIYEELDDFQSRRPIDVISDNNPILILDEPQKMEGAKTLEALTKFKPLMILRYSATHRTTYNKVYRLDALDAYNQKLVKKIAVRGIVAKGLNGTNSYLYLESIEISPGTPVARIEMEVRHSGGIKRAVKRLKKADDLFVESNGLDQYRGFVIAQIDANEDVVEFLNGHVLKAGEATGDITELTIPRIQIREAIKAHIEKEQRLFAQGIKVLSLFFIDKVVNYRDYSQDDAKGQYARIFEGEYEQLRDEYLSEVVSGNDLYNKYLTNIQTDLTHDGYFSIDRKTKRLIDPSFRIRGQNAGLSDDVSAYELILKDKERLLSFEEPVRFIFSHSALREGWDNPNVFVMCMLKHSDSKISRRQEVGRGLRLSVNQNGDRMDNPVIVHDVNVLTVVASESYKDFVANLQREVSDSLSARPRRADVAYFTGKVVTTETGSFAINEVMARQIYRYLVRHDYTDDMDKVAYAYYEAKANDTLAKLPHELAPYANQIFALIDGVFSDSQLPDVVDDRRSKNNPLNANFKKKEFQGMWNRINRKAVYRVDFDSSELVQKSVQVLDKKLQVTPLHYVVESGAQLDQVTDSQLKDRAGFKFEKSERILDETQNASTNSKIKYDLIGKISENTQLTRKTVAEMLSNVQLDTFNRFKQNPEHFIAEASRLINEQKATTIIERLSYDLVAETHDISIFTTGQNRHNFAKATEKLRNHIYDYAITDSKVEKKFAEDLDTSDEVVVYAKLPRGFLIPTPVGDYNPDWAISFKEKSVRHIYFVSETKGSMSTMELRAIEEKKIECARKFFEEINDQIDPESVRYEVVSDYGKLMEIVVAEKEKASKQ